MTTPDDDRRRGWEERHRTASGEPQPLGVLRAHDFLLPERGRALDLACGRGGSALWLAQRGLTVSAWDYAEAAIADLTERASARGLPIHAEVRDVCAEPPPADTFDVIVVGYFLDRALAPAIVQALRPGGLLFYETFVREAVSDRGPSTPDFRLAPNELLHLFTGLRIIDYREHARIGDLSRGQRDIATLVAQRV